jgi:hypothetical protein
VSRPLRIALLDGAAAPESGLLAAALHAAGHRPALLTTDAATAPAGVEVLGLRSLPAWPLRARNIGDGLEHVPHAVLALVRGRFDVAHAFRPIDALAAVAWARRAARPSVLTFVEPLRRETIANRRLRRQTLEHAVEGVGAVLAAGDEIRASLRRMLALDVPSLAPGDADGHLAVYADLAEGQIS